MMKRIAAVVLPQLACEIARRKRAEAGLRTAGPMGVLLEPNGGSAAAMESAAIDAVEDEARRYGVRPGQRVTEATALLAHLTVGRVAYGEIDAALGRVAEVALGFGPTVAIQIRNAPAGVARTTWGDAPFDTVWIDVTGAAHRVGGEEALLAEVEEQVSVLGHRARLAMAGGPRLAQALARWAPGLSGTPGALASGRYPIVSSRPEAGAAALAPLSIAALPLPPDLVGFLLRLGIFTVGDLARLPRAAAGTRLGPRAVEILEFACGQDIAPLLPYAPPREIVENASLEEGIETTEAALLVLHRMIARASARLLSRGEACTRIAVSMTLDRSIAKLRRAADAEPLDAEDAAAVRFVVELPVPLAEEADLVRVVRTKLERVSLFAPVVGVTLRLFQMVPAPKVQLDLSRNRDNDPGSLPGLLAELSGEMGTERVGMLAVEDTHRPEAMSRLMPVNLGEGGKVRGRPEQLSFPGAWTQREEPIPPPARLLPAPISLGKVSRGGVVAIGRALRGGGSDPQLFAVVRLEFLMRIEGVAWWTRTPSSRDYARAWLASGDDVNRLAPRGSRAKAACAEALVYVVRKTGEMFLQGWYE